MTKVLNIDDIFIVKTAEGRENAFITESVIDLNPNATLLDGLGILPLARLKQSIEDRKLMVGNFYYKDSLPAMLNRFKKYQDGEPQIKIGEEKPSLLKILAILALTDTKLNFDPEYYKTMTGGKSFDHFEPDFTSASLNARNLIISRKKFNVVLTATIDGYLTAEGGRTEVSRFFPFKVIKYGEPNISGIHAVVNDGNKEFLESIGVPIFGGIAYIDFRKFPVMFHDGIDVSVNHFLHILRQMKTHKLALKAYRYFLTHLKEIMVEKNIFYQDKEWFHGEEVEDEYVSDLGTKYLDIWEKGQKDVDSIDTVLYRLGEFGDRVKSLFSYILQIENFQAETLKEVINKCDTAVKSLLQKKLISFEEAFVCLKMLDIYESEGSYMERYMKVKSQMRETGLQMNLLELKFMNLRWLALHRDINTLGIVSNEASDRNAVTSPLGTITIKQGVVDKNPIVIIHDTL